MYCIILGKWVRCKQILCKKKKIVGSAIFIPSAPPQNLVHPAHCSVCSHRVFRTTSFARTCSAHPEHTKEIHPLSYMYSEALYQQSVHTNVDLMLQGLIWHFVTGVRGPWNWEFHLGFGGNSQFSLILLFAAFGGIYIHQNWEKGDIFHWEWGCNLVLIN